MSAVTHEQIELEPLTELFGDLDVAEHEALERLDEDDQTQTPQAIGTVIWTVRVRC